MRKFLKPAFQIFILFIASLVVVRFNNTIQKGDLDILSDEFTVNYLGILAGFSLTIIAFMYANLEKIRESLRKKKTVLPNIDKFNISISNIYKEIKDDTMFCFYSLVFCMVIIFIRDMDFMPSWNWLGFNEVILFYSFKMTSMAITTLAIFDTAVSTFQIIDATNYILDKHDE